MSLRLGRLAGLSCAIVFGWLLPGSVVLIARAAPAVLPPTFIVNSVGDAAAAGPLNDGICDTVHPYTMPHTCTLRAAIMKANHWPGGGATITFDPAKNGAPILLTIPAINPHDETTGDLNISQTTQVIGNGASLTIVDAHAASDRAFWIEPGAVVLISGLTIQRGSVSTVGGGGGYVDHTATLILDHSAVLSNTDTSAGGGGGLVNQGTLTVTHSLVQGNSTTGFGGGGLVLDNGAATVIASTIISNQALGLISGGGGLINVAPFMTLAQSTVSGNSATYGGGVEGEDGQMTVINSTISGNSAVKDGGGVLVASASSSATLYNATVADNTADANLTGAGKGGGVAVYNGAGPLIIQNSLIADNSGSINLGGWGPFRDDCYGAPVSGGYNLLTFLSTPDINTCKFIPGVGDLVTTTVNLGALRNNGGPTFTQALQPGSAAIDAGNPGGCDGPAAVPLATDQRGYPRVANGAGATRCDIGAFEVQRIVDLPLVRR